MHATGTGTGTTDRFFDIEVVFLDVMTLPNGTMIRESPTLQSTGQTRITDLPGGGYRINSFFDVFTEISLDGGQSWTPSDGPAHMSSVPEPGTLLLVGAGTLALALRRRWRN